MQAADGVVLASHWEGLPMALLEAAACGLPAVATDVPGSHEAIVAGETGYLCSRGDSAQMAAAMQRVMQLDPEERRAMGSRARQRAIAEFDLESVLDRWETLYTELLVRQAKPVRWAR
jgi:glycosyltransferase involved in cell wall biosynthesis